jgi:hypothetical protein
MNHQEGCDDELTCRQESDYFPPRLSSAAPRTWTAASPASTNDIVNGSANTSEGSARSAPSPALHGMGFAAISHRRGDGCPAHRSSGCHRRTLVEREWLRPFGGCNQPPKRGIHIRPCPPPHHPDARL